MKGNKSPHNCQASLFIMRLQLALEQPGFELNGSAYTQVFFNKYTGEIFRDLRQFAKTFSFFLPTLL